MRQHARQIGRHQRVLLVRSQQRRIEHGSKHRLTDRLAEPVQPHNRDDQARLRRNHRFVLRRSLERESLRAVRLNEHIVSNLRQFRKRKLRRGELAFLGKCAKTDQALPIEQRARFREGSVGERGNPLRRKDVRRGGYDNARAGLAQFVRKPQQ
ncbi:hypothetical protein SDC9_159591 [bioreactor metagenome]|uniref:Uncharacterized protein n=1 Tax=bioreactor metagenome TaxID=1076179 RepID=A0A645FFA0_9ZZZZ